MTAYDIASSGSHAAVCQLLEQYGCKVANDCYGAISNNYYYWFVPQPSHSHLVPAPLQSTSRQHDPVTSIQTFRDILKHGSKLSDNPKHQKSDTAPQQHSYDETAS